ncbi:hypothetical protein [Nocardia sp. XZ_19_385]|uniref:hypothetical protein n=1 Tax=Nocardia sp. XZ_19_385 TaxID=2769488 RepID=UPI00188FD03D|nr:hypothetical protein [Nocardia sp. XZ_19_385]
MSNVVKVLAGVAIALAPGAAAHAVPADPFGPFGYRQIQLEMPEHQALATGMVETYSTGLGQDRCDHFPWRGMPGAAGGITVSSEHGVVLISARPGQLTAEGIGKGSTRAAVEAAYDVHEAANGRMEAAVPGNPNAV